ncbi:hypothetical protein L596_020940 [Steinernema carpocapsae]|uniref:Uncharacterized protein n=1 Tax=Steinernema carpocapsae TaxID=34508 RepID=A0A4V6A127_STECR|nr:hypothetical protein L596_020940 [Steinernema carpocapsae]
MRSSTSPNPPKMSSTSKTSPTSSLMSSMVQAESAKSYLPLMLVDRVCQVLNTNLKCTIKDGNMVYTYKVVWEEEAPSAKTEVGSQKEQKVVKPKEKVENVSGSPRSTGFTALDSISDVISEQCLKKSVSEPTSVSCSSLTSSKLAEMNKKAPKASNSVLVSRKCDGPCQEKKLIQELHLVGLCEHAICEDCFENGHLIDTRLGGSGCPNRRCYLTDLAAICPDPAQRHRKFQRILGVPVSRESSKKISEDLKTAREVDESFDCSSMKSVAAKSTSEDSFCSSTSCPSKICSATTCPSDIPDSSCARLVLVKIFLREIVGTKKKEFRLYQALKICSKTTLDKACDLLLQETNFPLKKMKKRAFFAKNGSANSREWIKVEKKNWTQTVDKFWDTGDTVNLVFDCTN